MNKRIVITALVSLCVIIGCSDGGNNGLPPVETTVRLEGSIGLSSRAVIGSGYADTLEVCFARQDETGAGSEAYAAWNMCGAVRCGGAGNKPILFTEPQFYPVGGEAVRLHGYYPSDETKAMADAGAGHVTFLIDGATDVMATGCISGTTYSPVRTCTFLHLLTQVGLVCYSDRAAWWGDITGIEAVGVHTRQQLGFASARPVLSDVSGEGEIRNIPVQEIAGLVLPEPAEGDDLPEAQGYILLPVLPVAGTEADPLHLRVSTTKDGRGNAVGTVSDVYVSVAGGFRAGSRHVITLFFTEGNHLVATEAGVEPWKEQEQGIFPI